MRSEEENSAAFRRAFKEEVLPEEERKGFFWSFRRREVSRKRR